MSMAGRHNLRIPIGAMPEGASVRRKRRSVNISVKAKSAAGQPFWAVLPPFLCGPILQQAQTFVQSVRPQQAYLIVRIKKYDKRFLAAISLQTVRVRIAPALMERVWKIEKHDNPHNSCQNQVYAAAEYIGVQYSGDKISRTSRSKLSEKYSSVQDCGAQSYLG